MNEKEYSEQVKKASPKSEKIKNYLNSFLIGGLICALGQSFYNMFVSLGLDEKTAGTLVPVTLIFIAVIMTGIGVFDSIAKIAGAGTLVPITGFANAVASSAIEYKNEGYITGTAVNMFKIAGPVIVFGCASGVVYGIIIYILEKLWQ